MDNFRRALYYPYIHIKDDGWLKTAALFYDGLCRIKPDNLKTQDSSTAKALADACGFFEDVSPATATSAIKEPFLDFAIRHLQDAGQREKLNPEIRGAFADDSGIHGDKVLPEVAKQLRTLGLLKRAKRKGWYELEPSTAAMYMTFLANEIARQKGIAVVTDDPAYTPLLHGAMEESTEFLAINRGGDAAFALAGIVLKEQVPDPRSIRDTPVAKIIEFRRKHDAERQRFMDAVRDLGGDLSSDISAGQLRQRMEEKAAKVRVASNEYRLALTGSKIKVGSSLMGLSVPAWIGHLDKVLPLSGEPLVVGTLLIGGIYGVIKLGESAFEVYRVRRTSPWSYVHSLKRQFRRRSMFRALRERLRAARPSGRS